MPCAVISEEGGKSGKVLGLGALVLLLARVKGNQT